MSSELREIAINMVLPLVGALMLFGSIGVLGNYGEAIGSIAYGGLVIVALLGFIICGGAMGGGDDR